MKELPVAIPVRDDEPIILDPQPILVETYDKCAMYLRYLSLVVFIVIVVTLIVSVKK